jgi:hypothetical protein
MPDVYQDFNRRLQRPELSCNMLPSRSKPAANSYVPSDRVNQKGTSPSLTTFIRNKTRTLLGENLDTSWKLTTGASAPVVPSDLSCLPLPAASRFTSGARNRLEPSFQAKSC